VDVKHLLDHKTSCSDLDASINDDVCPATTTVSEQVNENRNDMAATGDSNNNWRTTAKLAPIGFRKSRSVLTKHGNGEGAEDTISSIPKRTRNME
jgi:hypothetical protein